MEDGGRARPALPSPGSSPGSAPPRPSAPRSSRALRVARPVPGRTWSIRDPARAQRRGPQARLVAGPSAALHRDPLGAGLAPAWACSESRLDAGRRPYEEPRRPGRPQWERSRAPARNQAPPRPVRPRPWAPPAGRQAQGQAPLEPVASPEPRWAHAAAAASTGPRSREGRLLAGSRAGRRARHPRPRPTDRSTRSTRPRPHRLRPRPRSNRGA